MIASHVNDFVWTGLTADEAFSAKYDAYRTQYGDAFKPFFPVYDNFGGDITWGSEPYVLYDSMIIRPLRNVYGEKTEQVMYTIVGQIPELFEFRDAIAALFNNWDSTMFQVEGYRINDIDVVQTDRTRGRDKVRQTYSTTLMLTVHYIPC